jgi:DNA-binding GntR family transcriptional regulator
VRPIRAKPVLSARVAAEIRTAILSGQLAPGTRIRQESLANRLRVSREPIRHALLVLEQEGLVRAIQRQGTIVAPLDRSLILDIYDMREILEPRVSAKLAERRDFDVRPLRQTIKRGRAAVKNGGVPMLIDLDLEFHMLVYQSLGNRVITEMMQVQFGHLRRAVHSILTVQNYRQKAWDEHEAIVEAIACNKAPEAASWSTIHVQDARELLSARFLPEALSGRGPNRFMR